MMDYILCLLNCICYFLFFFTLFEDLRFSKQLTFILLIIESLLNYFLSVYCTNLNYLEYMHSDFLLLILFSIFQYILIQIEPKRFMMVFVFCLLLTSLSGLIVTAITLIISPFKLQTFANSIVSLIYQFICLFLFYKLALYIRERKQNLSENLINKYLVLLICPTLLQYCIYDFYFKYRTTDYLILLAFSVFVTITLMIILYKQLKNEEEKTQNIIFSNLLKASQLQMHQVLENEEKLKDVRHDLKNHLIIIKDLAQENRTSELIDYINKIDSFKSYQPKIYCDNIYLNSILNNKTSENKNIHFKINIQNDFCGHFNDMDLCILVSNLIDNAIEELNKHTSLPQTISISLVEDHPFQWLIIKNPLSHQKNLDTEKTDFENHGLGLNIVKKIIQKYDGEMIIRQDNYFSVKIMFCLNSIEKIEKM